LIDVCGICDYEMKDYKYHIVGTVPKSNRKIQN
jgi:hypothetical protein